MWRKILKEGQTKVYSIESIEKEQKLGREAGLFPSEGRPHCANCGKPKGSKKTNISFPKRPCLGCGSTEAIVRYRNGYEISWERWLELFKDRENSKRSGSDPYRVKGWAR